jgi:hypothetical protein
MPEVVTEGTIVTYADDTTVYVMQKDQEAVYTGQEKAGNKIQLYMKSNALAANAEKTKFILFGRKKAQSIQVGQSFVEESKAEELLGVKISKSLTWTKQAESLKIELSKRVGLIRRLSHHLPRQAILKVITPMFTSKLQYAIYVFTDLSSILCTGRKEDAILRDLQDAGTPK